MQKVLRRSSLAQKNAVRRAERRKALETGRDRILYRKQKVQYYREHNESIREARKARREDYDLGPLAPWRDNTLEADIYGTFSIRRMQPPQFAKADRKKVVDWFIRQGDRVVVVRGRPDVKGKIGTVMECKEETQTVIVEGVNMIEVRLPEHMVPEVGQKMISTEEDIPLADVQLIYPLKNPRTGGLQDAIINPEGLVREDDHWNYMTSKREWNRYLQPQNIHLKWPEAKEPIYHSEEADTRQSEVETLTYHPSLEEGPLPLDTTIDELRNKYSKFRIRHDVEYLEAKVEEDEQAERKKRWVQLMTETPRPQGDERTRLWRQRKGRSLEPDENEPHRLRLLEQLGAYMQTKHKFRPENTQIGASSAE